MSNEQPPHQCAMQTDIPEIMQPKKECQDDTEIKPKQTHTKIDGHKQIRQKRQRRVSKDEGNTEARKRCKA